MSRFFGRVLIHEKMVASRQLQVVVTDCPAAAIKNGVVLIEQLDVGARELWDAILRDFRPTSIPTWTAATSLSSDWVGTWWLITVVVSAPERAWCMLQMYKKC
jgi:hypothetical protein